MDSQKSIKVALLVACASLLVAATSASNSNSHLANQIDEMIGHKSVFSRLFGQIKFDELKNKTPSFIDKAVTKESYQNYLQLFGKSHRSPTEFERRFQLFAERVKRIVKSKVDYLTGQSSFSLGINQFVDWDNEEIQMGMEKGSVVRDGENDSRFYNFFRNRINFVKNLFSNHSPPELIENGADLRRTGCVTSVRNQKNCGSCYSFAAMATVETSICMDKSPNSTQQQQAFHLSTQDLVDCFRTSATVAGCAGGDPLKALVFLSNRGFTVREECYPYTAKQGVCLLPNALPSNMNENCLVRTPGKRMLPVVFNNTNKEQAMMDHLHKVGPIYATIYTTENFVYFYRGVLKQTNLDTERDALGGHGLVVVGYGTEPDGTKYWLLKNSYSELWGHGGYVKIERGKDAFMLESLAKAVLFIDQKEFDEWKKSNPDNAQPVIYVK